MESGYGIPLNCGDTYELKRIYIFNIFIFKELFYQTIGVDFFYFLLKKQNRELFYKTPEDVLQNS
jgi:hypothetical protein